MGRRCRRCARGRRLSDARAVLRHRAACGYGGRLVPPGTGRSSAPHRGGRRDRPRRPLLRGDPPSRTLARIDRTVGSRPPASLFSGDAIYDGPLLDELPESSIDDYCETMDRSADVCRSLSCMQAMIRASTARPAARVGERLPATTAGLTIKWLANPHVDCLNIDHQREEVVQTMTDLDCGTLEVVGR